MPVERFYLDSPLPVNQEVFLQDAEHHHLAHVMRLSAGDSIELINGKGTLAQGTLIAVGKKESRVAITSSNTTPSLPPYASIAIPLMRPSKLEWSVEKGVELGVDQWLFYPADHSEKKELNFHQKERLEQIQIAAIKQSGRLFLPNSLFLSSIEDLFSMGLPLFFGDLSSDALLFAGISGPLLFVSGPEKGFSSQEKKLLKEHGKGVRLSPFILRAETAPLAALAILISETISQR